MSDKCYISFWVDIGWLMEGVLLAGVGVVGGGGDQAYQEEEGGGGEVEEGVVVGEAPGLV